VKIHCDNELADITSEWVFNDGYVQGYATVAGNNQLVISEAAINNSGVYTCYGGFYQKFGRYQMFIASSAVKVIGRYYFKKKLITFMLIYICKGMKMISQILQP